MESTTTSYLNLYEHSYNETLVDYSDYTVPDRYDAINKYAFIVCRIVLIGLAFVLNVVVILVCAFSWKKQAAPRTARPTLLVIVACSFLLMIQPMAIHPIGVHMTMGKPLFLSCRVMLAMELSHMTVSAVARVLVAAVAVTVAVRIQRLVSVNPSLQLALAALLVLASVMYGLVVVVPVFYFHVLKDHAQPCYLGSDDLSIAEDGFEAATIPEFVVPQCFVFVACILLLLAYVTRSRFSSSRDTYVHYNAVPGHNGNTTESAAEQPGEDPSLRMVTPGQAPCTPDRCRFPWHILLAGVASFLGGILYFIYVRMSLESPMKLWAASLIMGQMTGVTLPICWLLDADLRASCCCCSRQASKPKHVTGK